MDALRKERADHEIEGGDFKIEVVDDNTVIVNSFVYKNKVKYVVMLGKLRTAIIYQLGIVPYKSSVGVWTYVYAGSVMRKTLRANSDTAILESVGCSCLDFEHRSTRAEGDKQKQIQKCKHMILVDTILELK